ncbi:MAG: HAD family phosphatase [Brasilonema angustatum HA4187-MV1]|jgi:beta-phosphoglucomutase family hydrolase|nr:HAD family phosphatase [Brasilonema angustatum HA4187-MV1]
MAPSSIAPIPPYKALIFDCDGTLADTLPVHFQTWSASLQAVGANISRDWYYKYCGTSAEEMLQILKDLFGYQFHSESVIAHRQRQYESLINTVKEVQAVAEIVRDYYGKIPMAVASGGERVVLEATLNNIKLRDFFDIVVSIDDVEKGKPEPDIFLLASERLGVAPQDCIVYEDSDGGLEAAHRAGMRSIDVRVLWQA